MQLQFKKTISYNDVDELLSITYTGYNAKITVSVSFLDQKRVHSWQ